MSSGGPASFHGCPIFYTTTAHPMCYTPEALCFTPVRLSVCARVPGGGLLSTSKGTERRKLSIFNYRQAFYEHVCELFLIFRTYINC